MLSARHVGKVTPSSLSESPSSRLQNAGSLGHPAHRGISFHRSAPLSAALSANVSVFRWASARLFPRSVSRGRSVYGTPENPLGRLDRRCPARSFCPLGVACPVPVPSLFLCCLSRWRSVWATNQTDRKSTRLNSSHVKIS